MKKIFLPAFCLVALLGITNSARAQSLTCGMTYDVKGGGLQIGLGYFKLTGTGEITCEDIHGEKVRRSVDVTIGGHPLAARAGLGYFHIRGATGSFGFNGSIDDLYGHYLTGDAQATVGLGVGTSFSVQSPKNGLRLSIGVSGSHGLGLEAGLSVFTIEPANHNHSCSN